MVDIFFRDLSFIGLFFSVMVGLIIFVIGIGLECKFVIFIID